VTESSSRVLVAGATGYIGGGVAEALHQAGMWVRVLARDPKRLRDPDHVDDVFVGQATRPETLRGLCDGVDAVFSSIGIRSFARRPTLWEVDCQANLNLLEEARRAGVRHFVFVSVVRGREMARLSPIAEAREKVAEAVVASGLDYNVFAPTGFFNDMAELFKAARDRGKVRVFGDGYGVVNPLSALDLGEEVARVIRDPSFRNTVRAVGGCESFTHREAAELAFRAVGKAPRIAPTPPWLVGLVAQALRPFNHNAYALVRFFEFIARTGDMTGEPIGRRRLGPFFEEVAKGKSVIEAEASL
jgi:uncharacterized protein YbjT (DUF2867 family)